MGTSGSKPGWYPGEPAGNNFKAPPCSCYYPDHGTGEEAVSASAALRETHSGGGGVRKETQEREIASLPVVPLTDMQVGGRYNAAFSRNYN